MLRPLLHCLLLALLAPLWLSAQELSVSALPFDLPTADVICMLEDADQRLWVGADGAGLCRWDGQKLTRLRGDVKSPTLLASNTITALGQTPDGTIWTGTRRGAHLVHPVSMDVRPLDDDAIGGWDVFALLCLPDSSVWLSADGHLRHYTADGRLLDAPPVDAVIDICAGPRGTLLLAHKDARLGLYDPQRGAYTPLRWSLSEAPLTLCRNRDTLWVGTRGAGLVRYLLSSQTLTQVSTEGDQRINRLCLAPKSRTLWAAAEDRLRAYSLPTMAELPLGEGRRSVKGLALRSDGSVLVSGLQGASAQVRFRPPYLRRNTLPTVATLIEAEAAPLHIIAEDSFLWMRQRKVGIYTLDRRTAQATLHPDAEGMSCFIEKATPVGIYFATSRHIVLTRRTAETYIDSVLCEVPLAPSHHIRALHADVQGNLWVGTTQHLYIYTPARGIRAVSERLSFINGFASTPEGDLFISTDHMGLWHLARGRLTQISDVADCLSYPTLRGDTLWIGSQQGNLYSFDIGRSRFECHTEACGLTGDAVVDLCPTDSVVWVLTPRRIFAYDPSHRTSRTLAADDEWVQLGQFLCLLSQTDTLTIGGQGGTVSFSLAHAADLLAPLSTEPSPRRSPLWPFIVACLALAGAAALFFLMRRKPTPQPAEEPASPDPLLSKAIETIEANISNPSYGIEELSADLCMSRATLYRKLTRVAKQKPTELVKEVRLRHAAMLLRQGQMTVSEVANACGFNTPSYFAKLFKQRYGTSPMKYK